MDTRCTGSRNPQPVSKTGVSYWKPALAFSRRHFSKCPHDAECLSLIIAVEFFETFFLSQSETSNYLLHLTTPCFFKLAQMISERGADIMAVSFVVELCNFTRTVDRKSVV